MIPRRKIQSVPDGFFNIFKERNQDSDAIISQWETEVASYVGMPYAVSVNSGRRGMLLILKHLGITANDEVIVPAYTLKDLIPLIQSTGAKPIPADIDIETFNISVNSIKNKITPRTKAIIVLHAFGSPCAINDIMALANQYNIPVIEDCAHSLGSTVCGKQTGSFGCASFFSLDIAKPISAFGGGIVVSQDLELIKYISKECSSDVDDMRPLFKKINAAKTENMLFKTGLAFVFLYLLTLPKLKNCLVKLYRKIQKSPPMNIRFSSIQAQLGLTRLESLNSRIELRNKKAVFFQSLLKPGIGVQKIMDKCVSGYYFFTVMFPCKTRDIRKKLLFNGIDAGIEDEIADNCAQLLGYNDCPNTAIVYNQAIILPFYDEISESEIKHIAKTLNNLI